MNNKINLSLRIARQMRRGFGTWCTNSKTPSRCPLDASAGRSMVEMLGVLAIIGVLSVGAIAGYSKTMFKYKLNKQAESFNTFINNAIQIKPELERSRKNTIGTDFFYKANLIPDGMNYNKHDGYIYDIFNNKTIIYYTLNNDHFDYVSVTQLPRSGKKLTNRDREICRNMVNISKENADNLEWIQMRSNNSDVLLSNDYRSTYLFGKLYPYEHQDNYLHKATIGDIDDFCNFCDSDHACLLIISYGPHRL